MKDHDVADTFNGYFVSIVESLDLYNLESEISYLGLNYSNQDYLDIVIRKLEEHPSIQMIKRNFRIPKKFSFQLISKDEVKKIIKDLNNSKSLGGGGGGEIPKKILKNASLLLKF